MSHRSILPVAVALALLPAATAQAKPTTCKSADLRYPFQPGGPKSFGVFKLTIEGGKCTTAHRVAKAWMKAYEDEIKQGRVKLPKSVEGYAFKTLDSQQAQTYRERGRKGATTIRFDYRVPNG
jgi:hypothetical protein